jgi:hypothetical protein
MGVVPSNERLDQICNASATSPKRMFLTFGVHAGGSQMPDVVAHLETALAGLMDSQGIDREVWQRAKSLVVSILVELGRLDSKPARE